MAPSATVTHHSEAESAIRRTRDEARAAGSFLIRVWYESRDEAAGRPPFRCYVRNLQTGAERFLSEPEAVSDELVRQVEGSAGDREMEQREPRRAVR